MAKAKGGLGRGLGALLPEYEEIMNNSDGEHRVVDMELEKLFPNPINPAKHLMRISLLTWRSLPVSMAYCSRLS